MSSPQPLDRSALHERLEHDLLVPLACRQQQHLGLPLPSARTWILVPNLLASAQCLVGIPQVVGLFAPRCMLVGANDGAIDMMQAPVQLACRVCLLLQLDQYPLPDPGSSPTIEAGRNRLPGAILIRKIPPRRPVRLIQRMAFTISRWSLLGRPRPRCSGGRSGRSRSHCVSVKISRAIPQFTHFENEP
jgi:hypothetical protein